MGTSIHEISWRIKSMNKRKILDKKFTASLHGYQLGGSVEQDEDEHETISDERAKEIMAESHRRRMSGN